MDLTEVFQQRRSVKEFTDTPVSPNDLLQLLDMARRSPSGSNKCPWRFVITTNPEKLQRLSETHPYCRWLSSAKAAIAIIADPAISKYWLEDCSVVAHSIWLAATDRGLGVAWAAIYQSDNAAENTRRQNYVREALSIPDKFAVPIVLAVGHPAALPPEKKRPALEEIVYWESYPSGDSAQASVAAEK
ncbi:MAG: nitroreductase family protein [Chloroflexi bacterium]|nr:nitroreductase family protein [Chloroflexota bacterium]